jgi:aryl-alcohol dehydrogenase-like predicted oxidoreductase
VANFNAEQMRRIADHLARAGVPLAANQVNYSLLRRAAETNGVLEACRELDVALVAYFPLASGRLTQPSDSKRTKELLRCLAKIARAHDTSISQVALNWPLTRDSHVIPIPGAKPRRPAPLLRAQKGQLEKKQKKTEALAGTWQRPISTDCACSSLIQRCALAMSAT